MDILTRLSTRQNQDNYQACRFTSKLRYLEEIECRTSVYVSEEYLDSRFSFSKSIFLSVIGFSEIAG